MKSHTVIIRNTLFTYGRLVFSAGFSLVGSRWVLSSLGHTDYGIYSLVGTLIVFVTALNSLMASSAARHLAYASGESNGDSVNQWFNAAFGIHVVLAAALVLIGWPIGEYLVLNVLSLPFERLSAGLFVFRLSLVSSFVSMMSVPFIAMFTARQQFGELALWGVLQSAMSFCVAGAMLFAGGDLLLKYSLGVVVVGVCVNLAQMYRAHARFPECRFNVNMMFNKKKFSELFRFASWNLFGWVGVLLRDHGSAVLINLYFGPTANAAYAVAMQVSNQASQFSSALISAFSPAIYAKEGAGDRAEVLMLAEKASIYGTLLALLVAVPILATMNDLLYLWLGNVPDGTAYFCYCILLTFIIDRASSGYMLAVQATGRIAAYQATVGLSLICTLPIAWGLVHYGNPPWTVGLAAVFTMSITSIGRALWGRHMFCIPISRWLKKVVLPCSVIGLAGFTVADFVSNFSSVGFVSIVASSFAAVLVQLAAAYFFILSNEDRSRVAHMILRKIRLR